MFLYTHTRAHACTDSQPPPSGVPAGNGANAKAADAGAIVLPMAQGKGVQVNHSRMMMVVERWVVVVVVVVSFAGLKGFFLDDF